jgi:thiamine-monophosphate kinase
VREAELIAIIREVFGPAASEAVDDDASDLPELAPGATRVTCADQVVEGHHFRRDLAPSPEAALESAGWRAVVRNLSDLAACGASPVGFLWTLALPDDDEASLRAFARGAARAAAKYGAPLLGGDLSKGPVLACSVTAFGDVTGPRLHRSGAQPGDGVYLSREVGLAVEGLQLLLQLKDKANPEDPRVIANLWPEPELELGQTLRGLATACIDVSDGVGQDLARLCAGSGVGADIDLALPDETGEDYALLFTAPTAPPRGIRIGTISEEFGIRGLAIDGFDHFS